MPLQHVRHGETSVRHAAWGSVIGMDFLVAEPQVLLRTLVVGVLAYVGLVLMLRISGKRTLSQFNAFDFVVTVALGSTLATVLLSNDVPLLQGLAAFAVLIGMQFVITWTSIRSRAVARMAKSEPTVVAFRGQPRSGSMRRERLLETELAAALRERGLARIEEADLVVLETDGTITVVPRIDERAIPSSRLGEHVPLPADHGDGHRPATAEARRR